MDMFKQILQYFDAQQWKYHFPEDKESVAILGIRTENGRFHGILDVLEQEKKIIFFSIYPVYVPQNLRSQIAELLLRINYILFTGSFEMDFEDGEIRLKTSLFCDDCKITEKVIDHLIQGNIITMDIYFELINSFITEKLSLSEAIEIIY